MQYKIIKLVSLRTKPRSQAVGYETDDEMGTLVGKSQNQPDSRASILGGQSVCKWLGSSHRDTEGASHNI